MGDYVKVGWGSERFWCKVHAVVDDSMLRCTVDNHLISVAQAVVKYGDVLTLSKSCILEVATADDGFRFHSDVLRLMAANPLIDHEEACLVVMSKRRVRG